MKRFLLFVFSFCTLTAVAQNASVSGLVQDPSGAVIPKATVEFRNQDTGVRRQATTNRDGYYEIEGIDPAIYDATVQSGGFKTLTREGVVFHVGDKARIDFKMQIGASDQHVEVDGSGLQLNTTDGSVSTVVDSKFVKNIPLNGRSFQDLISMTPGVVTQSPQTSQGIGATGDFSVNGQRTESNYYMVDGVSANINSGFPNGGPQAATSGGVSATTALGTTQSIISVDALQEFRVSSSTYSAEYGRSPGGQFSFATRAGTNEVHGTAFDYLRNNFFDANNWFNDHFHTPAAALRQNDFGGTVGGPVWLPHLYRGTNRTFFFVSYEGLRLTLPQAASIQLVPDVSMRQKAPAVLQPILNAFPIQSANGIDYSSGLAQFIEPYAIPSGIDATTIRLDHQLSSKGSIFFRFGNTPSQTGTRVLSAVNQISSKTRTFTFGATNQFDRSFTNEFRLGYSQSDSSQHSTLDSFGGATPIDLTAAMGNMGTTPINTFEMVFAGAGSSILTTSTAFNSGRQWNVINNSTISNGKHSLKFGFDYRRIKSPLNPVSPLVETIYTTEAQVLSNTSLEGIFEKGLPATPIFNQTAAFLQDEWHPIPRLSLSGGVRWEIDPPPTEQNGNFAYTVNGNLSSPATLSLAPRGTALWKTSWLNFAPRLGVAWTTHAQQGHETVVRAGGGVFFDTDDQLAAQGYQFLGFTAISIVPGAALPATPAQLSLQPSANPPYGTIIAFPSHLQLPYTMQWSAAVQQALGQSNALTISYVASEGRRLVQLLNQSIATFNKNFTTVEVVQTGVTSNYQALQVQFQRTSRHGVQALASYTWSHSIDFGSQDSAQPATRGNSDYDVRNNAQAGLSWDLPGWQQDRIANALLAHWGLDGRLIARSAFPITILGNRLTDPGTGSQYYGSVNLVPNQPIYLYSSSFPGGREVNPAAFQTPAAGTAGNAPRNFVRGFGATQLNLAARRSFPMGERFALQFRAETFNLLNHPIFGKVDPTRTDATFGQATQTLNQSLGTMQAQYQQGGPRSMQFSLKLQF